MLLEAFVNEKRSDYSRRIFVLKAKTITINRTRDEYGIPSPKSERSYRTIKIDDILINQLKSYYLWCKKSLGLHLKEDDLIQVGQLALTR